MKYVYSGDLIRKEIYDGTGKNGAKFKEWKISEFGKKAKEYVEKGQVVPDGLVNELMVSTLKNPDLQNNNLLLDGRAHFGVNLLLF